MTTCTAQIDIARTPEAVRGYVREVPNLPSWTGFFRSVGESADGRRYPVDTPMGPIETWIETEPVPPGDGAAACTINSLIHGREEQAVLDLRRTDAGTAVHFTVRLPAGAPPERAKGQRTAMAEELRRLKELLEGAG
ncbi:hypothetical protein RCO28_26415 [Streptomyces sp. LHD-70]|uniref:SRPBCC family protein n=1 Tax=Streptomyces sp. LHD-70 TaxID=3072140 RepID=UPI00280F582A|nr:SRPBCC family protein [Streptomyces sp. LHD-70]MDQ8705989.1 hypothetical protein [Streptomyces sp. LHD-70]